MNRLTIKKCIGKSELLRAGMGSQALILDDVEVM